MRRCKREEQDGWKGKIIPSDLIAKQLYTKEQNELDDKRSKINKLEMELADLVEAAKVEDSQEYEALFEIIKKDKDDEPTDSFDKNKLKFELKSADKKSDNYKWLKKVDRLIDESATMSKDLKSAEKELTDAVEERILVLTDEEVDKLVYYKWFGKTVNDIKDLMNVSVKRELNILQNLEERYADTLDEIDNQIKSLLADFKTLNNDVVVG